MFISKADFTLRAENFRPTNPWNGLRILCGVFFLPHALGKFAVGGLNPATVGFFIQAGFSPAQWWEMLAAVSEIAVGIALVLGLATRYAALAGAAVLLLAAVALLKVAGFGWFWNGSGVEYLIFWTLACLLLVQHGFQAAQNGR